MANTNYYKGTSEHPYHLSIGAVILNDTNEVCCHYFPELNLKTYKHFKDFYILMRETMEMGETIEQTLHRGMMEEFGIEGDIIDYVGSIKGSYPSPQDTMIEKTTLYFLVKMKSFDPSLRSQEDVEKNSRIEWRTIDDLIPRMEKQGEDMNNTLDESKILKRISNLLSEK